eukprot:gene150-151_t
MPTEPKQESIVPAPRKPIKSKVDSTSILEEYLNMKSVLSYIGDLVYPTRGLEGTIGFPKRGERDYINTEKYQQAVSEVTSLWSPLVGMFVPNKNKSTTNKLRKNMNPTTPDPKEAEEQRAATASNAKEGSRRNSGVSLESHHTTAAASASASIASQNSQQSAARSMGAGSSSVSAATPLRRPPSTVPPTPSMPAPTPIASTLPDKPALVPNKIQYPPGQVAVTSSTLSYGEPVRPPPLRRAPGDLPSKPPADLPRSVLITKGVLRRLLNQELFSRQHTKDTLRRTLQDLSVCEEVTAGRVQHHQHSLQSSLQKEKESVLASARALQTLMRETVKLHYASLPERYILVVEGNQAKPRQKISKALELFWKTKLYNILSVAFGMWKILVAEKRSQAMIPVYRRFAALSMMQNWLKNLRRKRSKNWVKRWRLCAMWAIFLERRESVLPIQSRYRVWRDRRKLIAWHKVKPYLGPLSDIYLAPSRSSFLPFHIPDSVRVSRRMYWLAALRRWRIYAAKKRVESMKQLIARKQVAALVIQRAWYHVKGGFHTFLLMSCYRVRGEEDREIDMAIWHMTRRNNAIRIQRVYRLHYFKRIISAVVKVQCWYRGRLGYRLVDLLRVEKWAARKLHHWARGMMKFKHRCAHKIAHMWLRHRPGRLLRHLQESAKLLDLLEDKNRRERRYQGAARIQAVLRGVWTRRWVRRHRAAIVIQRPLRKFLVKRRRVRKIRERILQLAQKVVTHAISRAVTFRTRALVKLHVKMLIKPQALIRGMLVRTFMQRARDRAFRYGVAVVKVQRFWKASGAFMKAVQEVLALKRMGSNPFRSCKSMQEILIAMYKQTNRYFSLRDPRAGLRVSSLLYRLGLYDLMPMFNRKEFRYVSDIRGINMARLCQLYGQWQSKVSERAKESGVGADHRAHRDKEKWRLGKTMAPPKQIFSDLIKVVSPGISSYRRADVEQISKLFAAPEI